MMIKQAIEKVSGYCTDASSLLMSKSGIDTEPKVSSDRRNNNPYPLVSQAHYRNMLYYSLATWSRQTCSKILSYAIEGIQV